jgi:hypothetical protein
MHRLLDAFELDIVFCLDEEWCTLENIGTMTIIWMILIDLMDNRDPDIDLQLSLTSLGIAMLLQERYPLVLEFTYIPMICYFVLAIVVVIKRGRLPRYNNPNMLLRGLILFIGALLFWYKGLDNHRDYLRISNCLWKISASLAGFYLMQVYNTKGTEFSMFQVLDKKFVELAI